MGKKREGVGRKVIACSQSQTFNPTKFAYERGAIVRFDWLLASQSEYVIRHLSFMHNPTFRTQQDQNRYDGRVQSEEPFEGVFEVSVEETSKDQFL